MLRPISVIFPSPQFTLFGFEVGMSLPVMARQGGRLQPRKLASSCLDKIAPWTQGPPSLVPRCVYNFDPLAASLLFTSPMLQWQLQLLPNTP